MRRLFTGLRSVLRYGSRKRDTNCDATIAPVPAGIGGLPSHLNKFSVGYSGSSKSFGLAHRLRPQRSRLAFRIFDLHAMRANVRFGSMLFKKSAAIEDFGL
jgi:hypothetical protein